MRVIKVIADKAVYKSHTNDELITVTLIGPDKAIFLPDLLAKDI